MCIKDLFDRGSLDIRVNVPHFELAAESAHKQMIRIDLIQAGWALLVINLVANTLAPRLDIHIDDEDLLVFKA